MHILFLILAIVFIVDMLRTKIVYDIFFPGELFTVILFLLFSGYCAGFTPFIQVVEYNIFGMRVGLLIAITTIVIWFVA